VSQVESPEQRQRRASGNRDHPGHIASAQPAPGRERPPVEALPANVIPLSLFDTWAPPAPAKQTTAPQEPARASRKRSAARPTKAALAGWLALVPTRPPSSRKQRSCLALRPPEQEKTARSRQHR